MMFLSMALFLFLYFGLKFSSLNAINELAIFPMDDNDHSLFNDTNELKLAHPRRVKRQFGFGGFGGLGGCCPFGGIGPMMQMCCQMPIMAPCCIPPILPPILPPPMPILPMPMIGGCCSCCMPMCVPTCVRTSCGGGLFGGGLFGGGCPFGGWRQKMKAKQRKKGKKLLK